MRETIVDAVQYQPNYCRYKIFIIDEVHDLSAKAFDALLKTIEEPPAYVIFILATTEYNKVPPTIRSRCQKFEFHRATMTNLVERLSYVATAEGLSAEASALNAIARMADGGYRDALTLLEQAMITSDETITLQHVYDQLGLVSEETVDSILVAMKEGNVPGMLETLNEVARRGRDPRAIIESIMYRLSDLTRAAYTVEIGSSQDATREASLYETANRISRDSLLRLRGMISESHRAIRDVTLPRIWLEAELIRISNSLNEKPVTVSAPAKAVVDSSREVSKPKQDSPVEKKNPAILKEKVEAAKPIEHKGPVSSDQDLWNRVLSELPPATPIAMKLQGSTLLNLIDTTVTIGVMSIHLDWLNGNPGRKAHVNKLLEKHAGRELSVQFEPGGAAPKSTVVQTEAVELPLEGEALYKVASEAFKSE